MKKVVVLMLAAFLTSAAVPVLAEDMKSGKDMKSSKDECLLASKNCQGEVTAIQQKMKKLDAEIKKGKKVYTAEELKKLQAKLKEAETLLDELNSRP